MNMEQTEGASHGGSPYLGPLADTRASGDGSTASHHSGLIDQAVHDLLTANYSSAVRATAEAMSAHRPRATAAMAAAAAAAMAAAAV